MIKGDNHKGKKGNKSGRKRGTPGWWQYPKLTKRRVKVKVKVMITILIASTASQKKMILVIVRKQRKKKEQNKREV